MIFRRLIWLCIPVILSGCSGPTAMEEEPMEPLEYINFSYEPTVQLFMDLEDGRIVSVNSEDDATSVEPFDTPIPGHQGQEWRFLKDEEHGTSIVYAAVSWDEDDPLDYLAAGYWAYYPEQHPPDLDPFDTEEYSILDGPEIFKEDNPPELPVTGNASYTGLAGGVYGFSRPAAGGKRDIVWDGWEGVATFTANFDIGTIRGCYGCIGDLSIRTAVAPASQGDFQVDISDYELHLLESPIGNDGEFSGGLTLARHPSRNIIRTRGSWHGSISNRPDPAGNPRLVAGFGRGRLWEEDGVRGYIAGSFVGLSEDLLQQGDQ